VLRGGNLSTIVIDASIKLLLDSENYFKKNSFMEYLEKELLAFIAETYSTLGWPGIIALMAVESVFFPITSEAVMPLAGWMLIAAKNQGVWLILFISICGATGSLIGALIIYFTGAYAGRLLVERYGKFLFITNKDLEIATNWFNKYGNWAVFLCRLIPMARSLVSLPAGISRMPLIQFTAFTFAGSFIWSLILTYAGYQLGENWEQIRSFIRPVEIPILLIFLLFIAYYVYKQIRR